MPLTHLPNGIRTGSLYIGEAGSDTRITAGVEEFIADGAVTAGIQSVEINHDVTPVAVTVADSLEHPGLFVVKDTSGAGIAAHTVTLTSGTWNGTATIATLNAPGEALVVYFDSAGNGVVVENIGAVVLS